MKNRKPNRKRITYRLLPNLSEDEYIKFPEEVRKVYISASTGISIDKDEKLKIILRNPTCFEKTEKKSHSKNVINVFNFKLLEEQRLKKKYNE